MEIDNPSDNPHKIEIAEQFVRLMAEKKAPRVLELGTRRSNPEKATIRKHMVPHAAEYVGADFMPGIDVDVVADAHRLVEAFGENSFDAVIGDAVFEHFQYPWIVSAEICRVLKPGGLVYIQTHQTFPLHSYPYDYWRFSTDALKTLFSEQVGFKIVKTQYHYPCKIWSDHVDNLPNFPAYVLVIIIAEKVAHPDENFQYAPKVDTTPADAGSSDVSTAAQNSEKSALEKSIKLNGEKYKKLRKNIFFKLFIKIGDYFINYPVEAKQMEKMKLTEKGLRYERLRKNIFFRALFLLSSEGRKKAQ